MELAESPDESRIHGEKPNGLEKLVSRSGLIASGTWRFIRLRDSMPLTEMIDKDDIDLLGTRESALSLISAVYGWVRTGNCHARIRSGSSKKINLTLFSVDGRHRLELDIWIELWQLNGRQDRLRYEDCTSVVTDPDGSIQRLLLHLEGCLFIQHILSKGKKLSTDQSLIS